MLSIFTTEEGAAQARIDFAKDEVSIGRSEENDLVLARATVSKRHARLLDVDGRIAIVDLESANGTFVNGTRVVTQQVISARDVVAIGDFELSLVPEVKPDQLRDEPRVARPGTPRNGIASDDDPEPVQMGADSTPVPAWTVEEDHAREPSHDYVCDKCAQDFSVPVNFCTRCGNPVLADEATRGRVPRAEVMAYRAQSRDTCGSCKASFVPGLAYCPDCGAKLRQGGWSADDMATHNTDVTPIRSAQQGGTGSMTSSPSSILSTLAWLVFGIAVVTDLFVLSELGSVRSDALEQIIAIMVLFTSYSLVLASIADRFGSGREGVSLLASLGMPAGWLVLVGGSALILWLVVWGSQELPFAMFDRNDEGLVWLVVGALLVYNAAAGAAGIAAGSPRQWRWRLRRSGYTLADLMGLSGTDVFNAATTGRRIAFPVAVVVSMVCGKVATVALQIMSNNRRYRGFPISWLSVLEDGLVVEVLMAAASMAALIAAKRIRSEVGAIALAAVAFGLVYFLLGLLWPTGIVGWSGASVSEIAVLAVPQSVGLAAFLGGLTVAARSIRPPWLAVAVGAGSGMLAGWLLETFVSLVLRGMHYGFAFGGSLAWEVIRAVVIAVVLAGVWNLGIPDHWAARLGAVAEASDPVVDSTNE